MITEDFCSFEVAKLLKEKGFDEGCNSYFISDNEIALISNRRDFNNHGVYLSAPTLQMAMKWLREVHNIFIEISTNIDLNGKYHYSYTILDKECKYIRRGYTDFDWNYEETCKAAIKYCLENLI